MSHARKTDSRRRLERLDTEKMTEFSAEAILHDGQLLDCEVFDFNSEGIGLAIKDEKSFIDDRAVKTLNIRYGKKIISTIKDPVIVRRSGTKKLGFRFRVVDNTKVIARSLRLEVRPELRPSLVVPDPVKMEEMLHLEVSNLNGQGMMFRTSLSNKHLLPGMILEDAKILFPGLQVCDCQLRIARIESRNQRLEIGAEYIKPTTEFLSALAQFAIYGTAHDPTNVMSIQTNLTASGLNPKKVGKAVRFSVVSDPQDYLQCLRLRFDAYTAAQKIAEGVTVENMADDYDKRSIVLVAKVNGLVVGTGRLVSCKDENDKFPLEEYFSFDSFKGKARRSEIFEVSRLAILPAFQGSDILMRLFQEISRVTIAEGKLYALCIATRSVRKNYIRLGWKAVSKEVPHPVRPADPMVLMQISSQGFVVGEGMSGLAWKKVGLDVVNHLSKFGLAKKTFSPWLHVLGKVEQLALNMRRKKKSGK